MNSLHETRHQFILDVMQYHQRSPEQRYGQAFTNYLRNVYPEAADEIIGTRFDPFYSHYVDMEVWSKVFELVGL